ncbi:MAG: BTAD domain-containing putative transcriptional regulator, partial [Thermotogota bacterium]|nr:BTAD domain-containing putative transcriptional regulator [Thermotogota bacterium]
VFNQIRRTIRSSKSISAKTHKVNKNEIPEAKMFNKQSYDGYIKTFSQFIFFKNSKETEKEFPGAKKSLDIFKYLLTNYERKVQKKELCDIFWPEMSEQKAKQNLSSNLYYLRKGLDKIFEKKSFGKFFIRSNSHVCWLNKPPEVGFDFEIFENRIDQAEKQNNQEIKKSFLLEAIDIYTGDYLPFCNYSWAKGKRKEYQEKVVRIILELIDIDNFQSEDKIEELYEKGFSIAPLNEKLVMSKLQHLNKKDKTLESLKVYQEFKNRLENEFSIAVPAKIQDMMSHIIKNNQIIRVPVDFKKQDNFLGIGEFQKIIAYELNARNRKSLLLSVYFKNGFEEMINIQKFSQELFSKVRKGDRFSYINRVLLVLFSETGKIDLPLLIERFFPYFEKYCKEFGAKYKWHEVKHKKTKLITYGEWKYNDRGES